MSNYAVIRDGVVENTIVWDGQDELSIPGVELINYDELDPQPAIGWTWDGTAFSPPPDPVPETQPA